MDHVNVYGRSSAEQRLKFIEARLSGDHSMVTLCRMLGISTKNRYKWWHRFEQEGMPGLLDRSRASHSHPNATAEDMVTLSGFLPDLYASES
jgi:transposase-like protein